MWSNSDKTITVEKCDCVVPPNPCTCPTINVSGPSVVTKGGDTMTFTANVSGGSQSSATYNWTVTQGEIVSGQGTPVITVSTTPAMAGGNITATVEVGGLCDTCRENTASETAGIAAERGYDKVDEFATLSNDEVKARFDSFNIALQNDPSAQGYIINYGSAKDIAKREKVLRDAIRFRKYDASRFTFVRGGDRGAGIETQFFVVPSGVTPPTPDQ